jgi:uncharacterized damage-inducible protein DinB
MPTLGTLRERCLEEDVQHVVQYTNTRGQVYAAPLWPMMGHLVNHGTQHRCLAAVLLSRLGHSPGDLDVLIFLLEWEVEGWSYTSAHHKEDAMFKKIAMR